MESITNSNSIGTDSSSVSYKSERRSYTASELQMVSLFTDPFSDLFDEEFLCMIVAEDPTVLDHIEVIRQTARAVAERSIVIDGDAMN